MDWPADGPLFLYDNGEFRRQERTRFAGNDPALAERRNKLYLQCPNPGGKPDHFLPVPYVRYGDPVAIGLVGGSGAGKTHLLASIVGSLIRPAHALDLHVDFVDQRRHDVFLRDVTRLFGTSEPNADPMPDTAQLDGTRAGLWEPLEILLVTDAHGRSRPVALFDIAGGDLRDVGLLGSELERGATGQAGAMLFGLDALMFIQPIEDHAEHALRRHPIHQVLARLRRGDVPQLSRLPAAVAVTKTDRVRFEPVVDRWLRTPVSATVDPGEVARESADVYAFLRHAGMHEALEPVRVFDRCTLHFTSATGRDARDKRYARGVAPRRVLQPLLALLVMTGVLPGGAEVGR